MERGKEVVVLDASVVVKWFVEEEGTASALKVRDEYRRGKTDIWSTQLLPFEVLNALRYNPAMGVQELFMASVALRGYELALSPVLGDLAEASVSNALKYGITFYDSCYLTLAETMGRQLYTADEKMLSKLPPLKWVHHIKEFD